MDPNTLTNIKYIQQGLKILSDSKKQDFEFYFQQHKDWISSFQENQENGQIMYIMLFLKKSKIKDHKHLHKITDTIYLKLLL